MYYIYSHRLKPWCINTQKIGPYQYLYKATTPYHLQKLATTTEFLKFNHYVIYSQLRYHKSKQMKYL